MSESWLELNVVPGALQGDALLLELVGELVHGELRPEIETWFFFWEPELRLRVRWVRHERAEQCEARLAARLDERVAAGQIAAWYEGAHGEGGMRYAGEAEMYGAEMWPAVQRDWMNGSELALLLARLEGVGGLTRPREFHWQRHVHLVTNQLYGAWESEVELCLAQAVGYLGHIRAGGGAASVRTVELASKLAKLVEP